MAILTYQSKDGKKLYEAYVTADKKGKRFQKRRRLDFKGRLISSLTIAKRVEFEIKRELIAKRDGVPIYKWENWLEECLRRMRFSLKHSTILNYEKILNKWVPKSWKNKELGEIRKANLHELIFEVMKEATPHQKKNLKKMLSRVFEMAVEEELIDKNPTKGIKITLPPPKQQILTSDEVNTLLEEARLSNHRFYFHWALALFTGMRNGELYALRISDVDLNSKIIHVNKQFTSRDGLHETKTNLSRVVPIAKEIEPLIEMLISNGGYKETLWKWANEAKSEKQSLVLEDLLLPRLGEWRRGEQSSFLRDFCRGVGISEVKFHDLRATFITNMLSGGAALNIVMSIVGHRRIATTDVYNRLAGVGVKGSTNKLSYGVHFSNLRQSLVIPFSKK